MDNIKGWMNLNYCDCVRLANNREEWKSMTVNPAWSRRHMKKKKILTKCFLVAIINKLSLVDAQASNSISRSQARINEEGWMAGRASGP